MPVHLPSFKPIVAACLAVLAVIGLMTLLQWRQAARQDELETLRLTDPRGWLDELRWRKGFAAYVTAVRDLGGYDGWREPAPLFLIGRWAAEPADRPDLRTSLEGHCRAGLVFEDGQLRRFGGADERARTEPARYRIDAADRISVETRGGVLSLMPDPNGAVLRHLRMTAPDGRMVDLSRCG